MTDNEFNDLVEAANIKPSKSLEAARLVLVSGYNNTNASKEMGIKRQSLIKLLKKIPSRVCGECGAAVYAEPD